MPKRQKLVRNPNPNRLKPDKQIHINRITFPKRRQKEIPLQNIESNPLKITIRQIHIANILKHVGQQHLEYIDIIDIKQYKERLENIK